MMMRAMMKSHVIDFHKGKEELRCMEDELPVVIYIVIMSDIMNVFSQFSFVEDFINANNMLENE